MSEDSHRVTRKVDFPVFVWTISILSGAMIVIAGYLFAEVTSANARVDSLLRENQLMRESLVEVKTNLVNIKDAITIQNHSK